MPLPLSGPISFNDINVELGVSGTTQASLGQASYRTLAGVPSGQISMSNFYGKANAFAFTISSPTNNANLATLALAAGWPGNVKLEATVAPGVVMSSDSTGVSALTISGGFPGGVQLTNNGTIVGRGGAGAQGRNTPGSSNNPGGTGGPALAVSVPVTINNLGTIAGGGGGGGGGGAAQPPGGSRGGGGGGGGRSSLTNSAGGAGGFSSTSPGSAGAPGSFSGAGGGGAGATGAASGGTGGGWGSSGSPGGSTSTSSGRTGTPGGGGGSAVSGNPAITWINTGTRLGGIS